MITVVILDIVVIDVTEWLFGKHLKTGNYSHINYHHFNGLRVWPKNFPIYFQIYRLLKMAFRNKPD